MAKHGIFSLTTTVFRGHMISPRLLFISLVLACSLEKGKVSDLAVMRVWTLLLALFLSSISLSVASAENEGFVDLNAGKFLSVFLVFLGLV